MKKNSNSPAANLLSNTEFLLSLKFEALYALNVKGVTCPCTWACGRSTALSTGSIFYQPLKNKAW